MEGGALGDSPRPQRHSLAVALQNSVLQAAGKGHSGGGATIASLMPQARADNTWRSSDVYWMKWQTFCKIDGMQEFTGDEGALLRYLGWLYDTNTIAGASVRNYMSAICTGHTRSGLPLALTPLLQLALSAYINADWDRKALADPTVTKERRALPSSVARKILDAALAAADGEIEFIRNASAVLVNLIFFARGEAGASLLPENIKVVKNSISLAIALRKNQSRVAHTLEYERNTDFGTSVIDLLLRYDRIRRSYRSGSKYYWALPGKRHDSSASRVSLWLHMCLRKVNTAPPPQVSWTSHSLRMSAASECAAIHVAEYRILIWGDWGSARTFRETYLDGRVKECEDSHFFFGHLL